MNEELLRLLYGKFTTDATFEQFTEDLQQNDDLLTEAYNRLEEKPDFETFKKDLFGDSSIEQAKITPQEAGAPVEEVAAPDMESPLVDTSSESQEISVEEKKKLPSNVRNELTSKGLPFTQENVDKVSGKTGFLRYAGQFDQEAYQSSLEAYNNSRNSEPRLNILKAANYDPNEPQIQSNLVKQKTVDLISKNEMFKNLNPGQPISIDNFQKITDELVKSDKYLTQYLPEDIFKANQSEIDRIQQEVVGKYDLSLPSELAKAQKEFVTKTNDFLTDELLNNQTYKNRIKELQELAIKTIEESDYKINREKLGMGIGLDRFPSFIEGLVKGAKSVGLGYKRSSAVNELDTELKLIPDLSDKDDNETITYGGKFSESRGMFVGQKTGTVKEAKEFYKKEKLRIKAKALSAIETAEQESAELQYYKKGDIDQLLAGKNVFQNATLLIGEQIPNIALARATYGIGMYASEFGDAYFDNLYQHIENKNNKIKSSKEYKDASEQERQNMLIKPTSENLLQAIDEGAGDGAVSTVIALINTSLEKVGADNVADAMFGDIRGDITARLVKDGVKAFVRDSGKKSGAVASRFTKSGLVEYLTEGAQAITSQVGKGVAFKEPLAYVDMEEVRKNSLTGLFVGVALPVSTKTAKLAGETISDAYKRVSSGYTEQKITDEIAEGYLKAVESEFEKGNLTRTEADEEIENIRLIRDKGRGIPKNIILEDRKEAIDRVLRLDKLQKELEGTGEFFVTTKNKIKDQIDEEVLGLGKIELKGQKAKEKGVTKRASKSGRTVEQQTKYELSLQKKILEQSSKDLNIPFYTSSGMDVKPEGMSEEDFNTVKELFNKNKTASGVFTNGFIFVDESRAESLFNISVGTHEVLHPIIESKIGDLKAQAKMVDGVRNLLTEKQLKILDNNLAKRDYSTEQLKVKEFFTALADTIVDGSITFERTFFQKLVSFFQKLINKDSKVQFEIGFENPNQVLEFIKQYAGESKSGKLSEDTINAIKQAPDLQSDLEGEAQYSSEQDYEALYNQYVSGELDYDTYAERLDDLEMRKSRPSVEQPEKVNTSDFKKTLDNIGNNPEGYDPFNPNLEATLKQMITVKAKRFRTQSGDVVNLFNLPDFNIDDFASEVYFNMMKGKRLPEGGYTDGYIKVFDPNVNDSLYGYINAQLGNRMNSVLAEGKMTQEKFTVRAEEQIGLQDSYDMFEEMFNDELQEQKEEEETLIDPTSIFDNERFFNEAVAEVEKNFMSTPMKEFIFKETKNLVIGPMAKLMNVRESVIEKASQNLNTSELESTAPILFKAANQIIKIIPKGAIISDGTPLAVSEKLIGTGTGLPRKILQAFFEKRGRLLSAQEGIGRKGAGLEPFVKKKISKSDFLKAIGINEDGTHNKNIKPKSPESQTRRALIDLLGKLITNTRGRVIMAEEGFPLNVINDFAAGKDEAMYSKSEDADKELKEILIKIRSSLIDYSRFKKGVVEGVFQDDLIESFLYEQYGFTSKETSDEFLFFDRGGKIRGTGLYSYESMNRIIPLSSEFASRLDPMFLSLTEESAKAYTGIHKKTFPILKSSFFEKISTGDIKVIREKSGNEASLPALQKLFLKAQEVGAKLRKAPSRRRYSQEVPIRRRHSFEILEDLKKQVKRIPSLETTKRKINNASSYEERKRIIEQDTAKNNKVRRLAREYYIAMLGEYVHQSGISRETRLERIGFVAHTLAVDSPSNVAMKQLAEISTGYSQFAKDSETIQLEHLEANSKYNLQVLSAILLNTIPETTYAASWIDKRLSTKLDTSKAKGGFGVQTALQEEKKEVIKGKEFQKEARKINAEPLFSREDVSGLETVMGNILKKKTGIPVNEQMSQATARINADNRRKKYTMMVPSAEDFNGLLYSFVSKGKEGDAQKQFFKKTLTDPLNRAYVAMTHARQKISRDFKDLNKEYEVVKKSLNKNAGYKAYTNDQAIRVYLYKKSGVSNNTLLISDADEKALLKIVNSNPEMLQYAEYLTEITGTQDGWVEPKSSWTFGSVFDDVERIVDNVKRAEFIAEWKENADAIFSDNNLNKIQSYYGDDFRRALEDKLYAIEKGKVIPEKSNKEMAGFQKWLTGSVAVTMFLNRRSMVLQLLSFANFINWTDNNPIKAAKAFANIPQYASDLANIFNSDYLKERRGGLKTEVEAAVLANELRKGGADGFRGVVNKILQYGFTLTQIGDSLAISIGGATFYRNRKNSYLDQGLTEQEAHDQAWLDFIEISEESQQSARPDKLSMQQTNSVGRVFLAFQNTPMQYYRIITKSVKDLVNGRGDIKTNISKIAYYGFVQSLIFNGLQQALFAYLGDAPEDDEEKFQEEKEKRLIRTINNTLDGILRGSGLHGAYVATAKNVLLQFNAQEKKGFKADHVYTVIELLNLSAPVGIKLRTLYQGGYQNYAYNKDIIKDLGFDIDNPAYDIIASLLSFGVNIPADKVINMVRGISEAADQENEAWQRIALALGWSTWNLGMPNEKIDEAKKIKTKRKREKTRTSNKRKKGMRGAF